MTDTFALSVRIASEVFEHVKGERFSMNIYEAAKAVEAILEKPQQDDKS